MVKSALIFLSAATATVLLCGPERSVILSACVALISTCWLEILFLHRKHTISVLNDPSRHNPEIIAEALNRCIDYVLQTGESTLLLLSNPGHNPLYIRTSPQGELSVGDGHRSLALSKSFLWIADHPLPLKIGKGKNRQLSFSPSAGGRIRVKTPETGMRKGIALPLGVAVSILLYLNLNAAAAMLAAPLFHHMLKWTQNYR